MIKKQKEEDMSANNFHEVVQHMGYELEPEEGLKKLPSTTALVTMVVHWSVNLVFHIQK